MDTSKVGHWMIGIVLGVCALLVINVLSDGKKPMPTFPSIEEEAERNRNSVDPAVRSYQERQDHADAITKELSNQMLDPNSDLNKTPTQVPDKN
jgi:hypothetical protein